MGKLESLCDKSEPSMPKQKPAAAAAESLAGSSMAIKAEGISPEVVAAITASIYAMMGTGNLAVKIIRTGNQWATSGRQKIMDSRQFF